MTSEKTEPLSAEWVARTQTSVDELMASDHAYWWLQSDPDQGGARRLMRSGKGIQTACPQTPPGVAIGSQLHAYGGGSFTVAPGSIWFVGGKDSKVYRILAAGAPELIVPADDPYLYGDLHLSRAGRLLAVRGADDGDEIVELGRDGSVRVLVRSTSFLAAPRLHDGTLAYLQWEQGEMPWDASRLWLADVSGTGVGRDGRVLAGGHDEAVVQPLWGPAGALYFMSDRTGWWNLYRYRKGITEPIAPMAADCAPAPWEGGYQSYALSSSGEVVLTANDGVRTELMAIAADGTKRRLAANLTSVKPYIAALDTTVAVLGSTPSHAPALHLVDLATDREAPAVGGQALERHPRWTVSPPVVGVTQPGDSAVRYVLHTPDTDRPVPLIIRAHPGPTDDVPLRLDWTIQFFVSHGFAVAEVAYRGSTGQGRAFRQSLHGHWGEYDVEDCALVAEHLLRAGVASPGSVFITGASAGGYTALQAACQPGPFTGATATSAIIDPATWERSVPRFQRPHAAALAGPAGAVRAEAVRVPVLLIHGLADEITAASDARKLVDSLTRLGRPHESLFIDGGDHYLSAPHDRAAALKAELAFYEGLMSR